MDSRYRRLSMDYSHLSASYIPAENYDFPLFNYKLYFSYAPTHVIVKLNENTCLKILTTTHAGAL